MSRPTPLAANAKSLWARVQTLPRESLNRYKKLGRRGKSVIWFITFMHFLVLGLIILITPTRIGVFFNDIALRVRNMGVGGMFLLAACVILASHPPLFGFSGSMTLIGFTYGIWPGFLIASLSSMVGAAIAFISVRLFFLNWMRKFGNSKNKKWEAFGHVMKAKGTLLIIMIRWCPIPFAIGNGLFASIESVKLWQYMLANLLIQPRLLIPVFIGSRLISLADPDARPDPLRFWLNLLSIALSSTISLLTGLWIYKLTEAQMKKVQEGDLAVEALEALEEGALLGDYSGEEDDEGLTVVAEDSGSGLKATRSPVVRRTSGSGGSA
ncbi:hypothetical protein P7C73_g2419, partial [Tremellales sp. Uapishka_1]